MIASLLPAIQYLRAITWRDWCLFTAFLASFASLLWTATELHWHSAFMPYSLSGANNGKLIGASGTVGESGFRNKFYLFDNDLNLVKSIRLHNLGSCGQHALSNDGKHILNVVGIPYVGFNSLGGGVEEYLELISMDDTTHSIQYVIPPNITTSSVISCGYYNYPLAIGPIRLIGTPPALAHVAGSEIGLIDLSGKVVAGLNSLKSSADSHSGDYVATIERLFDEANDEYQVACYSIDVTGFKELFRERQTWKVPIDFKTIVVENGRLAIQEDDFVRIIDLNQNDRSLRETRLPWKRTSGELKAISETGELLIFERSKTELFAVSSKSASIVGRWTALASLQIGPEILLDDNRAIFAQVNPRSRESLLTSWNLNNSTIKTRPFTSLSNSTQQTLTGIYFAGVGLWGSCFFWSAAKRHSLLLGTGAVAGTVCLLLSYFQLHPKAEYFDSYEFDSVSIVLFSLWQIVLSIAGVWAFRYFKLVFASAATLGLTVCVIIIAHQFSVQANYYIGVFAVFGVGYIFVQAIISSKLLPNRQLSILGCGVLMTVIAVVIQLSLWGGVGEFIAGWVRNDFRFAGQQNSNWQTASVAAGLTQILFTLLVLQLAKVNASWTIAVQICLLSILILAAAVFQMYVTEPYTVALAGMLITTTLSGVACWLILNLVYRFLERPIQVASSHSATNVSSSLA